MNLSATKPARERKLLIALVDHEQSAHDEIRQAFTAMTNGWILHSYLSGEAALHHIAVDPTDVVLMDIRMPDISGVLCVRKLKLLVLRISVVVYTACSEEAEVLLSRHCEKRG